MKKLYNPFLFTKLTSINLKMFTLLKTILVFLPLLLIISISSAQKINRSEVPAMEMNLGEKVSFFSDNLKEHREFFVRLPEGYQETERNYPVIYLLDANNETLTYMKNLYFHSVTQIERLMQQGDIPESIIIGIPFKSSQWFSNTVSNSTPFRNYLNKELSSYIDDNYRTSNNNILIGQSYSALFVISTLPYSSDTFNSYIAIEPVLASGALESSLEHYKDIQVKKSDLQIIMGGTVFLEPAKTLNKQIANSSGKTVNVSLEVYPKESHGSVYYPALNSGLRKHFDDYRGPDKEQILTENFNHQSIINYFDKRVNKYQVETTDKLFQFAVYDVIFYNVMDKKFDQAFALWSVWTSQYKMYNANIMINNCLRKKDHTSAISFLQHLTIAMPNSVRALDRLATLHQQEQQLEQANNYRSKVKQLLTNIFDKTLSPQQEDNLNRYGYNLLDEKRNQEAIAVFKRIADAKPDSINAHDSLADAYESVEDHPKAIKTLEKAIALADGKDNVDIASLQQRMSRLKSL